MGKPRIFLGSSGKQEKLLQALTRGLGDIAEVNARTVGVYWRAEADDMNILDGRDDEKRAALIADRLKEWERVRNG